MKIELDGQVRTLDLLHVKLKHAIAIQEYTGVAVFAWQERLSGLGELTKTDVAEVMAGGEPDPAVAAAKLRKMSMYTDPAWITGMAAAHWLMLAQNGEDVPPLDDDYDCDVLGFAVAYLNGMGEEVKAKAVQDKPGPTASPGPHAPSSRRTASPETESPEPPPSSPTGS